MINIDFVPSMRSGLSGDREVGRAALGDVGLRGSGTAVGRMGPDGDVWRAVGCIRGGVIGLTGGGGT